MVNFQGMDIDIRYITYPLNGLIMVALPIGLAVFLTRRFGLGWRLFWIGAATFVLSQVGHIPFNRVLTLLFQREVLPAPPESWSLPFNAVVLGLSAGLWEELARYAAYRWWAKDARSWRKGLILGSGHGGIEAILLGLLVLYTFIQMIALRGADLSGLLPADQLAVLQQQVAGYWSTPWPLTLLGAVERAFTLVFHLSLSLLVLQAFTRGQARWLWLAVLWHALVDAAAVYAVGALNSFSWGLYAVEGVIGLFALASLWIIFVLRRPEPGTPPEPETHPTPEPIPTSELPPVEETSESLERSRYN